MQTVLVVDDEPVQRQLLRTLLKWEPCRIEEAADGVRALRHVERERPALFLLDLSMPKLVLRRLDFAG